MKIGSPRALALVIFTGLLVGLAAAARDPKEAVIYGTALVMEAEYGSHSISMLAVRDAQGSRMGVQVGDPRQLHGLRTGMQVKVTGIWTTAGSRGSGVQSAVSSVGTAPLFQASAITASGGVDIAGPTVVAQRLAPNGTVPAAGVTPPAGLLAFTSTNRLAARNISVLVIPLSGRDANGSVCPGTSPPLNTPAEVRATVLQEANPSGITVGSTYNKCSYGRSRLTAQNSLVADTVVLPCQGTSYSSPWSFSTCEFDDFSGIADAAEQALAAQGVPIDSYRFKVFLLPPGPCTFVGLGYVGCDSSDCRSWIGSGFWNSSQAMVHEIGHNNFLDHAGRNVDWGFDEYADESCAMGYCCADRCFNTPHAWQLGWISVRQFNGSNLRPGQTVSTWITSQALAPASGVRVVPSWAPAADPVFVGFRTPAGGDAKLGNEFSKKLNVYTANITGSNDAKKTTFQAALGVGDSWNSMATGLVLRFFRITRTGEAVLRLCRKGGSETLTTCQRGVDNDCNGLAGAADPACLRLLRRRPARTA
ncbi:hypothetical protein ABPG77_004968 [Micractinium sp. CCAP 211/92]